MRQNPVPTAKISPPRVTAVLQRPRLFRLLDELRNFPVLWIGGSPGDGKTALVASYIEDRRLPAIWYHVDREDTDAEVFLSGPILAEINAKAPGAVRRGVPPSTQQSAAGARGGRISGRRLIRDLYSRLPQPGLLVLDDCHEIASDAALHALLVDSAAEIPLGCNVILIGRGEPPSRYSRLIANRTLGMVDSRDLRFTLEETHAIASRFSADQRVSGFLHGQCAGWAAGVTITLERLRRRPSESTPLEHEMRKAIFGYYAGEVFDRASPEERRILVSTALVPRLSGPAANELSGSAQAQHLLNTLANRQSFTTRSATSTYEYDALFREFLLTRVEETLAPDDVKNVANRADIILEECSDIEALVEIVVRNRHWDSLTRLIVRQGMRLLAQGHGTTMRRWIDRVPAEVFSTDPWLAYWSGAAALYGNPGVARSLLHAAWDRFQEVADRTGQMLAASAMLESYQFEWSSFAPMLPWVDRLEACLGAISTFPSCDAELVTHANLVFALTSARPESETSALAAARLRLLLDANAHVNHRLFAGRSLLVAYCSMHDIESARDLTKRLQSMLHEPNCSPAILVATLNAVAYGLWFDHAYSDAEETLREAASAAKKLHMDAPDPLHHKTRYLLALVHRDRTEMADCIHATRQVVKSTDALGMAMLSQALAAHALLKGDLATVASNWMRAVLQADAACARPMQWMSRLALAGCRAKQGDCAGAKDLLQQALALFEGMPPPSWHRDHALVAAYLAMRRGDRIECHRLLSTALDTEQRTVVVSQVFAALPSEMAELCMEAVRGGIAVDSARALVQHYRLPPPVTADGDWPWPCKVYVMGSFRVLRDDAPLRFSRRMQKRPLELLQAIIAFGGSEVSAGALRDVLWPDSDGDTGYHALESGLYRLRQLLGAPGAVIMAGGKLSLDRNFFWVDMWAFEQESQGTDDGRSDAAARLARIRRLYAGHFLEQESDKPWALETRQSLRDKFLRSIREAAQIYETQRLWQEAANVYQTGIELDGMAEDLYRGLMICHRELGDHIAVLQVYRRCRDLLTRVLGVQPNPKTQAIYRSVRQGLVAENG
jgi:LuxR family maltose regulon positive regulatory protein